ncbi:MAG: hypothetical protein ACYCUG_15410, partial [Acidimicrobiales bacterium]
MAARRFLPATGLPATGLPACCLAACCMAVLAACGRASTVVPPAAPSASAPLDAAEQGVAGTFVAVAMGHLDQRVETFWQLFALPAGSSSWRLRTPVGVADNGGLVATAGSGELLVGFPPSQELRFSPLAVSHDAGASYTPGLLDAPLAATPDALAAGPASSPALAVTPGALYESATGGSATGGSATGGSATGGSAWSRVLTTRALAATTAGRRCRPVALTAVAVTPGGTVLGASCAGAGVVGLFRNAAGAWGRASFPVPEGYTAAPAQVVRLLPTAAGLTAVVRLGGSAYLVAWQRAGGGWARSAVLQAAGPLRGVAVTARGAVAVSTGPAARPAVSAVSAGARSWTVPVRAPAGTAIVV